MRSSREEKFIDYLRKESLVGQVHPIRNGIYLMPMNSKFKAIKSIFREEVGWRVILDNNPLRK